jgi:phage tail-like protein
VTAFALGGRAGWRIATTTCSIEHGALTAAASATYVSRAFDSKLPGCRWDRLRFDVALADGTSIAFSSYASDSDRSDAAIAVLTDADWSAPTPIGGPQRGQTDTLIRATPGRFLWIRIAFTGSAAATAVLRSLDITFPRATSLRMLPAVYSTTAGGADITERLLSIFDAMRFGVTEEIRLLASVIDPRTTNARTKRDFLDWLGGWFGLEIFRAWPEHRRRAVIAAAGHLFRRRGTPDGIRLFIELALGIDVRIVEDFSARSWWFAGTNPLGCGILFGPQIAGRALLDAADRIADVTINSKPAPYLDPFAARANRMTVVAPFGHEPSADELSMLRAVVDIQKPAHVAACIEVVVPELRLSVQARLGLDAVLGELRSPAILAGPPQPHLDAYVLGGKHS